MKRLETARAIGENRGMGDDTAPKPPPPEPETPEMRFIRLAETYCMTKLGTQPEVIKHGARQMEADYLRRYRNGGMSLLYDPQGRRRTLNQKFKWIAEQIELHCARWTQERPQEYEKCARFLREFAAEHPEYADKVRAVEALPLHLHHGPYALSNADREALHQILGTQEVTVEDVGVGFVESIAENKKKQWEVQSPRSVKRRRFSNAEWIAEYERSIAEMDKFLKDRLDEVETLLKERPVWYRRWLKRHGYKIKEVREWHGLSRNEFRGFQRRKGFCEKQIKLGRAGVNLQDLRNALALPHKNRELGRSQYLAEKKAAEEQARREQRRKANLKHGQGAKAAEERRLQKALDIIHGGPPIRLRMRQAAQRGIKLNEPKLEKQPYVTKMILNVHKVLAKVFPKATVCDEQTAEVVGSWFQYHDNPIVITGDTVRNRRWFAKRKSR